MQKSDNLPLMAIQPSWSGRVVYRAMLAACGTDGHGFKPWTFTNACGHICRYVDRKDSAAMLTSTVSRCHTRGESREFIACRWQSMQVTKHASEGSTLALKPRGYVTRSPKQGYQWPHEKDSKILFKKGWRYNEESSRQKATDLATLLILT